MFWNLCYVSIEANAEVRLFFKDLFDELRAGHEAKIQFEVRCPDEIEGLLNRNWPVTRLA